ncbi:tetratricopeptide repeat protein, partial [Streptomyces phaeochromogenes]
MSSRDQGSSMWARYEETGERADLEAAIDHFRQAGDAGDPAALNNLGVALSRAGRRQGAVIAIRQAADIRRRLAATQPDTYEPDLATTL